MIMEMCGHFCKTFYADGIVIDNPGNLTELGDG